jgi:hydrogenase nickel incorporation protein HypB
MTRNVPVLKDITEANSLLAEALRARFAERGVFVLDLIASPGAGKTSLLERTIEGSDGSFRLGVIEGDPHTSIDAERMSAAGVPVVEINTGGGCHLEASMIQGALDELPTDEIDALVIENVGNLICPTGWDLGEDLKVVVVSLSEGDDKPLKYPMGFLAADAAVINKIDLEPHSPARVSRMRENALRVNPELEVFEVSCLTGEGIHDWLDWLQSQIAGKRAGQS